MKFNLNDYVRVKLTPHGREILKTTYNNYQPRIDKNGWYRTQLWSLMEDFGPHIRMGTKPPFETEIELEISVSKLKDLISP